MSTSRTSELKETEMNTKIGRKRYNLALPEDMFDKLQQIADEQDATILDVIKKCIKVGLLAYQTENNPDSALIIREGDLERQILMI